VTRLVLAAISAALMILVSASSAHAELLGTFGHDDTRDGTATEIVSGMSGDDPAADPLASRPPNSYETFPLEVPEGSAYGGIVATVRWEDPRLDFDIYLYRQRPDGTLRPGALASSAGFGLPSETATFRPAISGETVRPGTYVLVVDNWCTDNADPIAQPRGCGIRDAAGAPATVADEDDFVGTFESLPALPANPLPVVTLSGPDAGRTTDVLTFTASATDDGSVTNYAFDLDGDGRFELDNGQSPTLARRFETPGTFNVGVRVTDDGGGRSFANRRLTVSAPAATPPAAPGPAAGAGAGTAALLRGFALSRPVFGGRSSAGLAIRYRLGTRARVDLALYRGTRRIRTLARGIRGPARTHRVVVASRGLRRGLYTVLLTVRTPDGRTRTERLASRRI
jgi:hypothetical protein